MTRERTSIFTLATNAALFITAVALAGDVALFLLLRPFWINIDNYLRDKSGLPLSFSLMILALLVFLAGLHGFLAARRFRTPQEGRSGRIAPFLLVVLPAAIAFTVLGGLAFKTLGHYNAFFLGDWALRSVPVIATVILATGLLFAPCGSSPKKRRCFRWAAILLLLPALAYTLFAPHALAIVAGPWLQLGEKGAMTVCWLTNYPSTGEVAYGEGLVNTAHSAPYGLKEISPLHRVTLTRLAPGARVPYRVSSREIRDFFPYSVRFGKAAASKEHAFTVPDPNADHVSFVLFSDVHEVTTLLPDLIRLTNAKHRDFVVFNGDFFSNVDTENQVIARLLQTVSREFAAEVPFVFVRGNHDSRGAFARHLPEYLNLPGGNPFVSSFKIGPADFLVLDTGEDKPDSHREYSGLVDFTAWREQESALLRLLLSTETWKDAPFRILLAHIPRANDSATGWAKVLQQAGLDLQIAGHIHKLRLEQPDNAFPVLIASGDSRRKPMTYPAAIVSINSESIDVDTMTPTGEHPGHWSFPARKQTP